MSLLLNYPLHRRNPYSNLFTYETEYLNINKDPSLRKDITKFFQKKLIKWIKNDSEFAKYKNKLNLIDSIDGTKLIYNLIRSYVNKHKVNWFDLRTEKYYLLKDYFSRKLFT